MMRARHRIPLARLRITPYSLGQLVTAAATARSSSDVRIVPSPSLPSSEGAGFAHLIVERLVIWSCGLFGPSCRLTLHHAVLRIVFVAPTPGQGFR
ncbi:uncharacterized protein LY79DRAFT_552349 [Colletotrichum navitas]|uniref:Uncharacterized protein n=1 Tax=Colletotrichum navitas TaxID=681940 RepID=A0AAD8V568_9PEZI|nr:uncharacterized protein LY79DRAFT_552349 [Colletotrichum navitas]KAK1593284.1 hypothetical protein LY79DRAFT_552349 [Colletotrichum navitas]